MGRGRNGEKGGRDGREGRLTAGGRVEKREGSMIDKIYTLFYFYFYLDIRSWEAV